MAESTWAVDAVVVALGAAALVGVWWRGCLRRDTLAQGPGRATGLHPIDLPVAAVLYVLLGQALVLAYALARVTLVTQGARGVRGLDGLRALGLHVRRPLRQLALSGWGLLITLPIVLSVGVAVHYTSLALGLETPTVAHELLEMLRQADDFATIATIVGLAVVAAPVVEEVIFRGLGHSALLARMGRSRRWMIVLVISVVFTAAHAHVITWHAVPVLFVLSIILGWLYERSGSLWPPILVHAGFNAFNIAMVMWVIEP